MCVCVHAHACACACVRACGESESAFPCVGMVIVSPPILLQGWSSAYTVEAVILQISATFVKGKARIVFTQAKVRFAVSSMWIPL